MITQERHVNASNGTAHTEVLFTALARNTIPDDVYNSISREIQNRINRYENDRQM